MKIGDVLATANDPRKARKVVKRILLDRDLDQQREALLEQERLAVIGDAMKNREPEAPAVRRQIEEFDARLEDELVEFTFISIGHKAWHDLLAKCPPTKAQRAENEYADSDPETFWPSAIAASCVAIRRCGDPEEELLTAEPVMTLDEANQLRASRLAPAQWFELWMGAREANIGGGTGAPKAHLGGKTHHTNDGSDEPATDSEFPAVSSSDG
jgi:hypothetical protein